MSYDYRSISRQDARKIHKQNKLLKIERHKYKLKLNDKVITNKQLLEELDGFSL